MFTFTNIWCFLLSAVSMKSMYHFDFDLSLQCDVLLALSNIVSDCWCVVLDSTVGVSRSTIYSTPSWQ